MDKKKTLIKTILLGLVCLLNGFSLSAATPEKIQFLDRSYNYGLGQDTINLYFNLTNGEGKRISGMTGAEILQMANFFENGNRIDKPEINSVITGVRIPKEFTFSILLDRSIPDQGKKEILKSIRQFVEMAPDTCVFISFYGDEVSNTIQVNKKKFSEVEQEFMVPTDGKVFYSGVLSKLAEFSGKTPEFISELRSSDYSPNLLLGKRREMYPGKNYLLVFADGTQDPDVEELDFISMTEYQKENPTVMPKAYGFYYTSGGEEPAIKQTLEGLARPEDADHNIIKGLIGEVKSSANMDDILKSFRTVIDNATYDYVLRYRAVPGTTYMGNVNFTAKWGNMDLGEGIFTIGSQERPWPEKKQTTVNFLFELLVALLVTVLTFIFFFLVMKILVPLIRSIIFKKKYYKKYEPEANVNRRICHYCKQELRPGQTIVAKCSHLMHKHCWEENGYKCAEYGQNCKIGYQEHVDWKKMFTWASIKECSQTIAGICAGLVSWIVYEICGRGGFTSVSEFIVGLVLKPDGPRASMIGDCVARTSSFLMIGLLLGFFISVVFRYKDEIRDKDWKTWIKIIGLSILTAVIGMAAFAVGADLLCLILSWTNTTYIPWYCSLPAYILFSLSVSLALTIKSTIPVRSALIGGVVSAVIGFLVLYFTKFNSGNLEWLNMLLDFIIYGGGLGASLITVRMLAENYFLVIQNGIKEGMRIPIHKWMNATGGGKKVSIGMTGDCEIQMNWEKSNKVAKEHAQLFIDHEKTLPVIKPLATGVIYNHRAELPVNRNSVLSNGDTFTIGETIFRYEEA